jgi:prephenate dehydrogenase
MITRVAIFGLGLLGGSLARALKALVPSITIAAYGRNLESIRGAFREKIVDEIHPLDDIDLHDTDLCIVSTPVVISLDIIRGLLESPTLGEKTLVIDVGSVKQSIITAVEKFERADRFVGCHPMAGSEHAGYVHSREDLFHNAPVLITPHQLNDADDLRAISEFWKMIKARPIVVPAAMHDQVISYTSHVPHIVASVFMRVIEEYLKSEGPRLRDLLESDAEGWQEQHDGLEYFLGSGFRDFSRLSASSPDMWSDICELNRENISRALETVIVHLQKFRSTYLDRHDADALRSFLRKARDFRRGLSL